MVTIKDIARELGLSVNTVSRALNNKPDVSRQTRARVLETARRLHYVPNTIARSLVTRRSNTLGLVVTDVVNPFYSRVIRGVEETARQHGYTIILLNTNERDEDEKAAIRVLRSKRVDGMIISPVQVSRDHIAALQEDGYPFVLINRYFPDLDTDYVINDNRLGAYLATSHLIRLGHRRITHITGPEHVSSVRERLRGYRQALEEGGVAADQQHVIHTSLSLEGGYRATQQLLDGCSLPTALFTYSDLLAVGALKAIREAGLRVPEDVALVGYDDIEFAAFLEVPLTTISQRSYEIGSCGVELLLDILANPGEQRQRRHTVLQPRLVVRKSCGAALTAPAPLSAGQGLGEGGDQGERIVAERLG